MAPYVGPFQLQVVCRRLWSLVGEEGDSFDTIDLGDVERHGDVETALRGYFSDAVAGVASTTKADEQAIRDWFQTQLITVQHFRNQTLTGPVSGDVEPAKVLRALEDAYLVRSDTRAEATWYELAHDQLITPVLDSNREWRSRLEPWRRQAETGGAPRGRSPPAWPGAPQRPAPRQRCPGHSSGTRVPRGERPRRRRPQPPAAAAQHHRDLGVIAFLELILIVLLVVRLLQRGLSDIGSGVSGTSPASVTRLAAGSPRTTSSVPHRSRNASAVLELSRLRDTDAGQGLGGKLGGKLDVASIDALHCRAYRIAIHQPGEYIDERTDVADVGLAGRRSVPAAGSAPARRRALHERVGPVQVDVADDCQRSSLGMPEESLGQLRREGVRRQLSCRPCARKVFPLRGSCAVCGEHEHHEAEQGGIRADVATGEVVSLRR